MLIVFLFAGSLLAQELPRLTGHLSVDSKIIGHQDVTGSTGTVAPFREKQVPFYNGVFSLILPGAGQFMNDDYIMTGVFVAVEAGLLTTALIYNGKGVEKTTEFENFADAPDGWSVVRYAEWINKFKGGKIVISPNTQLNPWERVNWDELNAFEETVSGFSHKIAGHGEQQYYEMIGKYNQFTAGWYYFDGGADNTVRPAQYLAYSTMRGDANKLYDVAAKAVIGVYANHLLSCVHAVWETIRSNKSIDVSSEIHPKMMMGMTDLETSINLRYSF